MNHTSNAAPLWPILFLLCTLTACTNPIERSGFVVDQHTNEPLPDVSIELYLKHQTGDSLREKVVTDQNGYFHIREKRAKGALFELHKPGYLGLVSSLSGVGDTVWLERVAE